MRLKCAEQCQLLKAQWDGYSDGLCRACTPMLPPIAASLGTPFSRIITIAISIYRVIGMVMIAFVRGSHVRQTSDGCYLNPPGGHLGKPKAPAEEHHTGSLLLLLRFLRSLRVVRLEVHSVLRLWG